MKLAFGYTRISIEEQSNFSLQGQRDQIERFALANGYEIVEWFEDNGVSDKSFDRPQWRNLEKSMKLDRSVKAVIVAKFDRLNRNTYEELTLLKEYKSKYAVSIVSVAEVPKVELYIPWRA